MEKDDKHIDHGLLMAYLLGEADGDQIAEVDQWLSDSEDNASYLKSLEILWIESGKLSPPPVSVNTDKAWDKVSASLKFEEEVHTIKKSARAFQIKHIWRAAAMIVLVLGVYGVFKLITGIERTETLASIDHIVTDTLKDGSIINLNTESKLTYPKNFDKKKRKVKLEGEAYFIVEHEEDRPFIIELSNARVEVLGTEFNVKEIPEEHMTEVYVKTGSVRLTSVPDERDTNSLLLENGEKGYIDTKTGEIGKRPDVGMHANVITWLSNKFVFDDVRLEEVAGFLEDYFVISIEFGNDSIKDEKINTTFKNDDIDDILNVIAGTFGLKLEKENQTYILKKYED
jgi:ferric-dicitrate binding protein FerR (iron transport regulator)